MHEFPGHVDIEGSVGLSQQDRVEAEARFLADVYSFIRKWISNHQGTALEFINDVTDAFGLRVRMYLLELTHRLIDDGALTRIQRDYIQSSLNAGEILKVLQTEEPKSKHPDSTLDELFARAVQHRHSEKFIEVAVFGRLPSLKNTVV